MTTLLLCTVILGLALLTGCGVETQAGVLLATVAVTSTTTPAPTATPDPLTMDLPHVVTREFMGTVVAFRCPPGWDTEERGQYVVAFDAAAATGVETPPSLAVYIQLSRRFDLDENMEAMSPYALSAQNQGMIEYGVLPPEAALLPDDAYPFLWGVHDAALIRWRAADDAIAGLSLVVMNTNRDRFVWLQGTAAGSRWEDFQPTLAAMLSSVTLDGEALPAADVLTAVANG
jgi:hypothetical protein